MAPPATPKGKIKALRVTARRDSFRRIGRKFTAEPVDIPVTELKEAEAAALRGDKLLVVHEVEIDAPAAPAEADAEGKKQP